MEGASEIESHRCRIGIHVGLHGLGYYGFLLLLLFLLSRSHSDNSRIDQGL